MPGLTPRHEPGIESESVESTCARKMSEFVHIYEATSRRSSDVTDVGEARDLTDHVLDRLQVAGFSKIHLYLLSASETTQPTGVPPSLCWLRLIAEPIGRSPKGPGRPMLWRLKHG